VAERHPAAGAEDAGRLLERRVEVGPQPADGADHDRVVEEGVGHEHGGDAAVEAERRQRPAPPSSPTKAVPTTTDGSDERDGHQRADHRAPGKS
jgi:hypothetical protein